MELFTFLTEDEFIRYSSVADKNLNEVFQEINQAIPSTFFIQQRIIRRKRFFRRPDIEMSYTLYTLMSDGGSEVGYVNIGRSRQDVMTFFYGILTALLLKKHNKI